MVRHCGTPAATSCVPGQGNSHRHIQKMDELAAVKNAFARAAKTTPLDDWTAFAKATKLKASVLKKSAPLLPRKTQPHSLLTVSRMLVCGTRKIFRLPMRAALTPL